MKVLFVNGWAGRIGGAEVYVGAVAGGLARRGHGCFLLSDPGPLAAAFPGAFAGSAAAPLGSLGLEIERWIVERRIDVAFLNMVPAATIAWVAERLPSVHFVHDHALCCLRESKLLFPSWRPCRFRLGPVCVPCGSLTGPRPPGRTLPVYASLGAKRREVRVVAGLPAVVVASAFMRDELVQNGVPEASVRVIPLFSPLPPDPAPPAPDGPILYVGAIFRSKGLDLLIRALARVPGARLVVAGDGTKLGACRKLARRLGIEDRVEFRGYARHEDLPALYRSASVCVVPSRWPEPFGLVGLEAMAHGRPVIGFRIGAIPEWLADGETGFLVEPFSTADLARRIASIIGDPALAARMGEAGRRAAAGKFAFDRHLDGLESTLAAASTRAPCRLPA
jgi:glycosyltransferase involved in cell wall biosynthesis